MKTLVIAAAAAAFAPLGAAIECPTFNAATDLLSPTPCNTCTGGNADALEAGDYTLCAWCYNAVNPADLCRTWTLSITSLGNPCAGVATNGTDSPFSLGGDNCDCSSPTYTDCKSCTANPKCNWVSLRRFPALPLISKVLYRLACANFSKQTAFVCPAGGCVEANMDRLGRICYVSKRHGMC